MPRRTAPHHARPRLTEPTPSGLLPHLGDHPCDPAPHDLPPNTAPTTCIAHAPHLPHAPADPAPLLDCHEARLLLRVSRNTLYRLAAAGRIPGATKVGNAWRFHRALLLDWLARPTSRARPRHARAVPPDLPIAPRRPGRPS